MSDPDATADGGAAAIPTTPAAGTDAAAAGVAPPPPGVARRGGSWPWVVVGLVALILIGGWIASRISVNYYVITPGDATPVSPVHRRCRPRTPTR